MVLGISSCLLGNRVRYDGGHKLDHYLVDTLGQYVEWVPVCPEVECGLPVPREAMRLVRSDFGNRLITIRSRRDITDQMRDWALERLLALQQLDLRGFVFKSKSPSSGFSGVKVYSNDGGSPSKSGVGIFAQMFMQMFPNVPVTDEGRLHDAMLRENFVERVFAYDRWRAYVTEDNTERGLVLFHARHKLLLMAHSPKYVKELGAIVAHGEFDHAQRVHAYGNLFTQALSCIATIKKNVNVLQHIAGFFKKNLSQANRKELSDLIQAYHQEQVPLIVPITMLKHYVRVFDQPYLEEQYYIDPHPMELKLRNHA